VREVEDGNTLSMTSVASMRDRAVERSLRSARAKAVTRSDRFISTAIEILSETGRTDFTVQELVDRAKASLRSFYQHFSSKDELLLALFEEVIASSVTKWRPDIDRQDTALDGLSLLLRKVYGRTGRPAGAGINRALSAFHLQLAETRPSEYARVLAPLRDLVADVVRRGVGEGVFREDIDADVLSLLVMQALVGASLLHALGAELTGDRVETEELLAFCLAGLGGAAPVPAVSRGRNGGAR